MKAVKELRYLSGLVCLVVLAAACGPAESRSGPRIPTTYFVTTGTGESDQGIPPDPYVTFSYELSIRDLKQVGEMEFDVTSLHIQKNYGLALAALGFVDFVYPTPAPVSTQGK